jgi:hypothetical protein
MTILALLDYRDKPLLDLPAKNREINADFSDAHLFTLKEKLNML